MQNNQQEENTQRAKTSTQTSPANLGYRGRHRTGKPENEDAMANPASQPDHITSLGTARKRCNDPSHPPRKYVGQMTDLQYVITPDNQPNRREHSPQPIGAQQRDPLVTETTKSWTPHQTHDSEGNANFHENSEGIVLTNLSDQPYCNYCKIPSHPRWTCPMRIKDLAGQVKRLHHHNKGAFETSKVKKKRNTPCPTEQEDDTNNGEEIRTGLSQVKVAMSQHTTRNRNPEQAKRLADQTDMEGKPKHWLSENGKLVVSPKNLPLCHYCGVPSHGRDICRVRITDEDAGRFYNIHPNRGNILSNNEAARRLQPLEGASYQQHKKLCREDKDRARKVKSWNQKIDDPDTNVFALDGNHNTRFTIRRSLSKSSTEPKLKRRAMDAGEPSSTNTSHCYPANYSPMTHLKLKTVAQKPMGHPKFKAQLRDDINQNVVDLNHMPPEILEKILSHAPFYQRIGLQRVSKRIREVTLNSKFWESVTIQDKELSNAVMKNIIKAGTTSLNIPDCVWKPHFREVIAMENFAIDNRPKFTFLGLQGYKGDDALMAIIVLFAADLTTLDLSEARYALITNILNKINRHNKLTAINLSRVRNKSSTFRGEDTEAPSALNDRYNPLRASNVSMLITKCIHLTDIVLCGAGLSEEAIHLICTLISPTVTAINFAGERVKNENLVDLTRRCPLVKYINVSETMVHHTVFPIIAAVWQYSMINISLPERFSRELKLYTDFGPYGRREEFRKSVMTMPKLEYLHIGHYSFHPSDIMFRRDTVRMLSQMFDKKFPTLNINYNPFSTQGPSQSDPNRKFRNVVTPEGWEWRG